MSALDTSRVPRGHAAPDTREDRVPARLRSVRPVRTELLRGIGPWAGAAVALTIWVTMYPKVARWQGHWTDTTDLLRVVGLLLCGPVAAAAGCWQGGRERRRGTGDLWTSFPRTRLRRTLPALAPAALWPLIGYLIGASGCLLATWPYASGPPPFVSLVVADAVAIAALGVLGFVAGRLVPWRLAAPALAVVTYVGLALPMYTDADARWLDPGLDHSFLWDRPVWWFAPASAVWTGGLAVAALLAYAARRRAVALVPLVLAVLAAVPIARTGDSVWRPDPDPEAARLVCDDGVPRVCVTEVNRKLLPAVSAALAGANAELRGVPGAPARWIEGPRALRAGEVRLPAPADLAVRDRLPDPAYYANWAVGALLLEDFREECGWSGSDHSEEERAAVDAAVHQWLAPSRHFRWPEAEALLERLEALDAERSRAYLARYLAADDCDDIPVP
ncbi:hypothetical protein ACWGDX_21605 [Streptomyces sp. NPDC055025]